MDRNLGASRVAQRIYDTESYGSFYQWGRDTDGHENPTSTTTTQLISPDTRGHSFFVTPSCLFNVYYDWYTPQDDSLWQGVDGKNNPCPASFRLPTQKEWKAEITKYGDSGLQTMFGLFESC